MFTPKRFYRFTSGSNCAFSLTQIRISSGSSETEVKELAVMPCTRPGPRSAVTTVTPVANWPSARRNSDVVGVVGAMVEVFEDSTDPAQGRALASRIIIAKRRAKKECHDGAEDCDFGGHRARGLRVGEPPGARGRAHRNRFPRSIARPANGAAAPRSHCWRGADRGRGQRCGRGPVRCRSAHSSLLRPVSLAEAIERRVETPHPPHSHPGP